MRMRRAVVTAIVTVVGLGVGVTTASAQTMEFGKDEAEEVGDDESEEESTSKDDKSKGKAANSGQAKSFLKEGKKLYKNKKYDQASLIFYKIINKDKLAAETVVPEARYQLGKTLFRMELYQGALSQFGQIVESGESHPFYVPTLNGLLSLAEVIPAEPSLREYLAKYADLFPQQVPEKYRDRYAYLVGRHFYNRTANQKAVKMLKYVSQRSPLYPEARYILAITHVSTYNAKPAVNAFKGVLQYLLNRRDSNGSLNAENKKLLELARLGMARVFYSTGDYETSLKYYGKIPRESPRWAQALFESSWAYFQIDRYNKALGNLHSLNSPFFDDAYFPEGLILSSVIYFYNCKYDRVRYQLDDFEYLYTPLKEEMQRVLDENPNASAMYEWYDKIREKNAPADDRATRIIRAAVDDKEVRATFQLVKLIDQETKKLESMPSSWKDSALASTLNQEASLAHSFALEEAGQLARQRLKRRLDRLESLINQKQRILVEVAQAEKGQIEADLKAGMNVEGQKTKKKKVEADGDQMHWKFNGEYWRDEIGRYVFNVQPQCKR